MPRLFRFASALPSQCRNFLANSRRGQSCYSALVTIDPASLHLSGDIALQAGMPAEAFIESSTQTTLQYLMEPLTSTARKALRQM